MFMGGIPGSNHRYIIQYVYIYIHIWVAYDIAFPSCYISLSSATTHQAPHLVLLKGLHLLFADGLCSFQGGLVLVQLLRLRPAQWGSYWTGFGNPRWSEVVKYGELFLMPQKSSASQNDCR